jgi:hypothetical protein
MEEVMTTDVTPADALRSLWDNADFNGKEFCALKDNGDLVLKKSDSHAERTIGSLTPENVSLVTKALLEKFPEVEARVGEVEAEWNASEDRVKLMGKVSRLKEYLLHTSAIGDFNNLLQKVSAWEQTLHDIVQNNYKEKLTLIEKAEKLSEENEHWKETTQELKDMVEQWKSLGYVEKERNDELWNRMEAARNKFFERKRQHHEEQEREMLQNLDLKMEIVEKAESYAASEEWKEATELFRQLMDQWKAVGRTIPEKNEELWNRFILAQNNFFERKRGHFEAIKVEQEANYGLKVAIIERAEAIKDSTDWTKTAQAYAGLMDEWKSIGRVPIEKADELWNRFNDAKEVFFSNRRQHQEVMRVTLEDNYAQKLGLLKRAEELKHSNQWREATEEMNELMNEWKKIGPVPREHVNTIWEQFIGARKFFFERKDADRERRKQQVEKQFQHIFSKTKNFLHQLETELKEEEERLADFRNAMDNVTPGNKEEELRSHLNKLIAQCEVKIRHKQNKIEEVQQQMQELETKRTKKQEEKKEEAPEPEA